jgi:D-amino-acid oxidase
MEILVIGAGVSGLTCAVRLAEAGHRVRVRTAAPPHRTTSRVAGALWGSTPAGPAARVPAWATASHAALAALAAVPGSGVALRSGTLLATRGAPPPPSLFPGVAIRPCTPPPGVPAAFRATLPVVDMPRHLDHLVARLEHLRVALEVRVVASLDEAAGEAPVVVNCTGLGARELAGDAALRAVRGQHVVVEDPGLEGFRMTEPFGPAWAGWVAHGERAVLGGVAQDGDEDLEPRAEDAEGILARCAALDPRLEGARVLAHEVGLRPARAAVRVEAERRAGALVVHDYGHGGCGVGLSWGCAEEVVRLVERGAEGAGV